MRLITNVDEARSAIELFNGAPEEFALSISDELQDSFGMNMAIITDCVLAKGWIPDGFEQQDGFRIYRYKAFE